jgi:endonuclease-8
VPEGDTLRRTAEVLGRTLRGDVVVAATGRTGGAQLSRLVGSRIDAVRSQGKHLLIDFEGGLTLHSHLGMHGSWHRYRPGERWRRRDAAVAVLETATSVAVCFGAPTVELIETRALSLHPVLGALGPDLLADPPDLGAALDRLQAPERASRSVAEALLDQEAVAGIGNVYRSEVLARSSIDPFIPVGDLPRATLETMIRDASELLHANLGGGVRRTVPMARPGVRMVYGRAGRPCRRCGATIRSTMLGQPPRRLYWCPACQVRPA